LAGAVPDNKELLAGIVPAYKELLAGTVPANKELLAGRVPANNLFHKTMQQKTIQFTIIVEALGLDITYLSINLIELTKP
jgi:hypothetical protein